MVTLKRNEWSRLADYAAGVQNTVSASQYVDVPHKTSLLNDGPSTRPPTAALLGANFPPRKNLSTIKQQRGFFTLKIGSPARTRTSDTLVNSQMLYQLSYRGTESFNDLLSFSLPEAVFK